MKNTNEKPILFNGEMVRAILEGRKTQTRRVVKNLDLITDWDKNDPAYGPYYQDEYGDSHLTASRSPYGQPGDRLWAKEPFQVLGAHEPTAELHIRYTRDGSEERRHLSFDEWEKFDMWKRKYSGKSSLFMFRSLSRLTLEITDIRVERLQDISEADAIAEGVDPLFAQSQIHEHKYRVELDLDPMPFKNYLWHGHIGRSITQKQADAWPHQYSSYSTAFESFSSRWDSINGKPRKDGSDISWAANPWVFVVSFKKI